MTDLLDRAVSSLRTLSPEAQDDVARLLLQWVGEDQVAIPLSADEDASFAESLQQAAQVDFATEAEVGAVWAKHSL